MRDITELNRYQKLIQLQNNEEKKLTRKFNSLCSSFENFSQLSGEKQYLYYFLGDKDANENQNSMDKGGMFRFIKEIFDEMVNEYISNGDLPDFKKYPYDIHILLVGFTIYPLVLSMLSIQAKNIILIYSRETKKYCPILKKWVAKYLTDSKIAYEPKFWGSDDWYSEEKGQYQVMSSDHVETFKKIKEIDKTNSQANIAIDITGGKKSMVAGTFYAGISDFKDIFYVDFEDYAVEKGIPIPGSEFLRILPKPKNISEINMKPSKYFGEVTK